MTKKCDHCNGLGTIHFNCEDIECPHCAGCGQVDEYDETRRIDLDSIPRNVEDDV